MDWIEQNNVGLNEGNCSMSKYQVKSFKMQPYPPLTGGITAISSVSLSMAVSSA
jgi:hypothetical protein